MRQVKSAESPNPRNAVVVFVHVVKKGSQENITTTGRAS